MRPTKFSGPILYSGNPRESAASLEDLPIGFNPDYSTFFDEFQGVPGTVPVGYNFSALASGTFKYSEGNSLQSGADQLYGWSSLSSDTTNPAQNNSGGTVMAQESLQFNARKQLFMEGRASLSSPATCEFFFGCSIDEDWTGGFTSIRKVGFELVGGTNSLRLVAKGGGGNTSIVENVFTFPNGSSPDAQHTDGEVNLAPVLGIRIWSSGTTANGLVADFYVNRRPVGTIRNTEDNSYLSSSIHGLCTYFKKTSEIAGLTIGTLLASGVTSSAGVIINGTSYDNTPGLGSGQQIYVDQTLTIGTAVGGDEEDVRVAVIGNDADGNLTATLERGVNSTTVYEHAVDSAIEATTQACLTDYVTSIFSRYPRGGGFQDYLVEPGR
tara:strand:- start:42 stop:1187 length:1146 start_codon:yes stop_codon:yes gene_type:complete